MANYENMTRKELARLLRERESELKKLHDAHQYVLGKNDGLKIIQRLVRHDMGNSAMFLNFTSEELYGKLKGGTINIPEFTLAFERMLTHSEEITDLIGLLNCMDLTREEFQNQAEIEPLYDLVFKTSRNRLIRFRDSKYATIGLSPAITPSFDFNTYGAMTKSVIGNILGNAKKYGANNTEIVGRFDLDSGALKFSLENAVLDQITQEDFKDVRSSRRIGKVPDEHGQGWKFGLFAVRKIIENGFGGELEMKVGTARTVQIPESYNTTSYGQKIEEIPAQQYFCVSVTIPELLVA